MLSDVRRLESPAARHAFTVPEMLAFRSPLRIKHFFQLASKKMLAVYYGEDDEFGGTALISTYFDYSFERRAELGMNVTQDCNWIVRYTEHSLGRQDCQGHTEVGHRQTGG